MTNEHDYEAALEAGRLALDTEFRATSVRYDLDRNMLEILTTQGGGFVIPLEWVPALANLTLAPGSSNGFGRLAGGFGFWPADIAADHRCCRAPRHP